MSASRDSQSDKTNKRLHKNGKNASEYQERVLYQVHEIFGSILEPNVILLVVQTCNWKLQESIEHLITLSADINTSNKNINFNNFIPDFVEAEEGATTDNPDSSPEEDAFELDTNFTNLNINDEELKERKDEFKKFELKETESLCDLKVQYRFVGPEASSVDDSDVIIEKESSHHSILISQNSQTNICQSLSLSTESSSKTTCPQVEMVSTASPSSSPINNQRFKACFKATFSRIKSAIQRGFKIMVILRGLPGSGKSHLAKDIAELVDDKESMQFIFCTDDFFMKRGKVYDFDPSKLSDAHAHNQQQVLKAARNGVSPIIIDNTNTQCWEMKAYVGIAVQHGYFIEILEPNTYWAFNVNELTERNEHGVQKQNIRRMLNRYERNITGAKLMKKFSLKYEPLNMPPQPCIPKTLTKQSSYSNLVKTRNGKKRYRKRNKKVFEKEEKLEEYVPVRVSNVMVIDAVTNPHNEKFTASQLTMKTYGADDDDLSPKENSQGLIEDKWEEDGTSLEEDLKVKIKHKESDVLKATLEHLDIKNIELGESDKGNESSEGFINVDSLSYKMSCLPNDEVENLIIVDETKESVVVSKSCPEIDNINSISWKEVPYPTSGFEFPTEVKENSTVTMSEASTNTDLYDFNVLFMDGRSEPKLKILDAYNRNINEGFVLRDLDTLPPRILKLDKSSMTNEIDVLLQLPTTSSEGQESDIKTVQEIIDMFPDTSKDFILYLHKNVCNGDSLWVTELLLAGIGPGEISNAGSSTSTISENLPSNISNLQNRKKQKSHISEDNMALKKHIEEKIVIKEAAYHPHTLRLKKWKKGEPNVSTEEILESQSKSKDVLRFTNDLNVVEMESAESPTNSNQSSLLDKKESDGDDSSESEETVELGLSWEFIKNLESLFGNSEFQPPHGLLPKIKLNKSVAQDLYTSWLESMQQQIDTQQEHSDEMIAKDAEYAKSLEEAEAKAFHESSVVNFREVMDMELASAVYKKDLEKQQERETPNDLASRLTRQILNKKFPHFDPETLSEVLFAHDGNFKETVQFLEAITGQSLGSSQTSNKQKSLMVKVKEDSLSKEDDNILVVGSSKDDGRTTLDELAYENVLQIAYDCRQEAEKQSSLRSINFEKASSAYRSGRPAVSLYYSEMAKLHSKRMEKANATAATSFLAAQTHVLTDDNILDLHNLYVVEALTALDIFLDHQLQFMQSGNNRSVELVIITGRGNNSDDKKCKIKPAVSKKLRQKKISFTEVNPGRLKIILHRNMVSFYKKKKDVIF